MMLGRARILRLIAFIAALTLWLGPAGVIGAAAAGETPAQDGVRLLGVTAVASTPTASSGPVQFEVTVDYELQTLPRAFFLLFVFDGASNTSSSDSSKGMWVSSGTGQARLTTIYHPTPGEHPLTLIAALFKDSRTVLAWSRTQPFSLTPWPGEQMFVKALAARKAGNYNEAVTDLTAAIQVAPNVGNYYCWRADSRLHLGQYEDAIADYTQALNFLPGDRSCRVGRGIAYLWQGEPEQAIADLTKVIDQSDRPDRWTIWARRARGIANANLGEFSNAIADYKAYLSLIPNVPNVADRSEIESWIADLQSSESATHSAEGTEHPW
jgi:hypothetical protein